MNAEEKRASGGFFTPGENPGTGGERAGLLGKIGDGLEGLDKRTVQTFLLEIAGPLLRKVLPEYRFGSLCKPG